MRVIAMIPARMGSQRLKKKNLRLINGISLISHAIQRCKKANCFQEIWVNSEDLKFKDIAHQEQVNFHHRDKKLADNNATSEDFITDFLKIHDCDFLVQVHSIAPLLHPSKITEFTNLLRRDKFDTLLSVEEIQIECCIEGKPINFDFNKKTNSQELNPVQRISWNISGWRKNSFLDSKNNNKCATYNGRVGFFKTNEVASHVIKTQNDLDFAEYMYPYVYGKNN
jgi:CMP-N-acetylneuraminic acid synthetase